jgi:transposase
LEVSAQTLVVDLSGRGPREFPNTAAGHRGLVHWLGTARGPVQVCLEATGQYGLDVALALDQAGLAVMVANPRAVRHFAEGLMQRSKTDRLDAVVLREFAGRMPFVRWVRPSPETLQLLGIAHRARAVTEMLGAEKNRLHAAGISPMQPALVRLEVVRHIRSLEQALDRLLVAARKLILAHPPLARRHALLLSVPGIGEVSALHLLAELQHFGADATVRQWVAYAGLDPRQHQSGSSVAGKPRISRKGNRNLRRALYMPALVAVRRDPHLRNFYQRLRARAKTGRQALVAVMRKLLHAIFGMFKHDRPYQGEKIFNAEAIPESLCA